MESSQPAVGDSAAGRGKEFGEGFMQEPFEDGKVRVSYTNYHLL